MNGNGSGKEGGRKGREWDGEAAEAVERRRGDVGEGSRRRCGLKERGVKGRSGGRWVDTRGFGVER